MATAHAKDALRARVWRTLHRAGATPSDPRGTIPDFEGADRTADRLAELPEWPTVHAVKSNPDRAQLPVRRRALADGKLLCTAVPRMETLRPFFRIDPTSPTWPPDRDPAVDGEAAGAPRVHVHEVRPLDLVICGSVAVNRAGVRIGKGAGCSDLEVALLSEAGLITARTLIAAPVHPLRLLDEDIPETPQDFRVDLIVTPTEVLRCDNKRVPLRIAREHLTAERLAAIPVLRA